MKRTAVSGITVIILSWTINTTHAQLEYNIAKLDTPASSAYKKFLIPGMVKDFKGVHVKAETNFTKTYKNATDITWYTLNDKRLMVRFFDNGVQTKIFYSKRGNQDAVVRYYNEDKLPNEVRGAVKSTYYDFNIFMVIEVTVSNQTAYLVKIEDKTCTKTIRFMNGEMNVVEEFKNL
ncbi:hypothetical protein A4D02_22430 [Niastella koreensis]|uniref:Uncharacterized protein n=2 Tax=Niastella koreensis TaxID=354356 RepID=G8TFG0_NIAKG|nr:hypothetical protein [Niastella koreensis]AEV98391.1 hypothetical protein Niako_2036 [Niastella koreensis GR20-10]OQP53157.1 hypothetical protein A4D02_22430 [Niastella koreensis]